MEKEFWRDIKGYEGLYQISNWGRVKSLKWGKERILKPARDRDGYLRVSLYKNGKGKWYKVHRLVAEAWLTNPDNLPEVNHINEIKTDNHVENIEWCDRAYNINYGSRRERMTKAMTNGKQSKPVVALDIQGRVVHVFPSMMEAERNGFNQGKVSLCCHGKRKFHKGLIWQYQEDFLKKIS